MCRPERAHDYRVLPPELPNEINRQKLEDRQRVTIRPPDVLVEVAERTATRLAPPQTSTPEAGWDAIDELLMDVEWSLSDHAYLVAFLTTRVGLNKEWLTETVATLDPLTWKGIVRRLCRDALRDIFEALATDDLWIERDGDTDLWVIEDDRSTPIRDTHDGGLVKKLHTNRSVFTQVDALAGRVTNWLNVRQQPEEHAIRNVVAAHWHRLKPATAVDAAAYLDSFRDLYRLTGKYSTHRPSIRTFAQFGGWTDIIKRGVLPHGLINAVKIHRRVGDPSHI